jgi:long-chain acyl-CoA synthetase
MGTVRALREWSTPPRFVVPAEVNATDDVFDNATRRPDHAAFARSVDGVWRTVTAKQFADQVTALAAGLIATGIRPGDRIALMSATRYEWALCDFAILTVGAVTVPVYETSSAEQVAWILRDSDAAAVMVENAAQLAVVDAAGAASVRHRWLIDGGDLDTLAASGKSISAAEVQQRRREVSAERLASIVYSSGTTGRPKGCMISHRSLVAEVRNTAHAEGVSETVLTDRSSILLFLPLAHIFARAVQMAAVHNGTTIAHTGDLQHLPTTLREFRPTILLAVPRVFEKLFNTASQSAASAGHARLFRAAEATATAYSHSLDTGHTGLWLRLKRRAFDRLVYTKLRDAMGGRVTHAVSGGAPLGARLGHFLRGAGVTILEGYGLTETTAGVTLNLPSAQHIGSVGRPLPGCTVRVAADGEVLVKGPNVFAGYWHDEPATRQAFDAQGWLRTGDLGTLDNGYLTITGRKKDLIITASGKNVAPAFFEDRLRAHWLVDECLLVGDRRPYIAALLTLDPLAFVQWKQQHRKPAGATVAQLRHDPSLRATIQTAIDEVNQAVSHAEAIKQWQVLPDQFTLGDELTATQKLRREHVLAKLADEIDALYSG